jgi:hypothetical protein
MFVTLLPSTSLEHIHSSSGGNCIHLKAVYNVILKLINIISITFLITKSVTFVVCGYWCNLCVVYILSLTLLLVVALLLLMFPCYVVIK